MILRHGLHRERDHALAAQPLDALGVRERCEKPDQDRAGSDRRDLVGGRTCDPDDRIDTFEHGTGLAQGRPRLGIVLVGEAGDGAGTALDHDLEAGRSQTPDRLGHERHPALAGGSLTGNDDTHTQNLREGISHREGNLPSVTRIAAFTAAMCVCDPSLEGHAARVGAHAEAIACRLGWSDDARAELRLGAALHDVGKVNVRSSVLHKPGRLDAAELAEIRAHPVEGAWLIAGVRSLTTALPYVLFHHERWDGEGYPTRRSGSEIPLEGRVLAVADAFDAMTSLRPYRERLAGDEAAGEIERCAGTQFDPHLAEIFVEAYAAGEIVVEGPLAVAV